MKKFLITALILAISVVGFASYESELTSRMDKVNKSLEEYYAGTTAEMEYAAEVEYEAWDEELDKVYKLLLAKLPKKQQDTLIKEQKEWVQKRDKDAEKSVEEFAGGSFEDMVYTAALMEATKERAAELAKRYDRLK